MTANPTAFRDAERHNDSDRNAQIFKDINLSLAKHPITGDIATLTNIEAVKRSVRNLINTNFYERPFHPEIGSNVRSILFEPVSPVTASVLERHVRDVVDNFEPRAEILSVQVNLQEDVNDLRVTIEFKILTTEEVVVFTTDISRIR